MCNQVFAYSAGATCGQVQIVGIIALTVGMTADPDRDFRVAAERAGRGGRKSYNFNMCQWVMRRLEILVSAHIDVHVL